MKDLSMYYSKPHMQSSYCKQHFKSQNSYFQPFRDSHTALQRLPLDIVRKNKYKKFLSLEDIPTPANCLRHSLCSWRRNLEMCRNWHYQPDYLVFILRGVEDSFIGVPRGEQNFFIDPNMGQ